MNETDKFQYINASAFNTAAIIPNTKILGISSKSNYKTEIRHKNSSHEIICITMYDSNNNQTAETNWKNNVTLEIYMLGYIFNF